MAKNKYGLPYFRAQSWSGAANGQGTERQPGKFYMVRDVDPLLAKIARERAAQVAALVDRHAFELRRAAAIEAFLMAELGR